MEDTLYAATVVHDDRSLSEFTAIVPAGEVPFWYMLDNAPEHVTTHDILEFRVRAIWS